MDYQKHYDALISRGKNRLLESYAEKHHIQPRCLGGTDDPHNLVYLTPEEHYVAHQLLVKMYPKNSKLIYALNMMGCGSKFTKRNNKRYGWIKRKFHQECKNRTGVKNSQFDTMWITNGRENKKIKKVDDIPEGWYKGRKNVHSTASKKVIGKKAKVMHSDTVYITDGIKTKRIERNAEIPKGWYKGRTVEAMNDLMWITNGEKNTRIKASKHIPEGWYKGRTI